jgi:hypothetical protein
MTNGSGARMSYVIEAEGWPSASLLTPMHALK